MLGNYIGPALRLVRKEADLSQEKLAAVLSSKLKFYVRQNYISKIETSRSNVSWNRLGLICKLLKCRVSYVIKLAESLQENDSFSKRRVND